MNDKVNRAYINGFGVSFGPSGYELEAGADEETQAQAEALYGKKAPALTDEGAKIFEFFEGGQPPAAEPVAPPAPVAPVAPVTPEVAPVEAPPAPVIVLP